VPHVVDGELDLFPRRTRQRHEICVPVIPATFLRVTVAV
jgi:hypothetical protein